MDKQTATLRLLDSLVAKRKTPGLQYLHLSANDIVFAHNCGFADPSARLRVADRTTFNAYSVTKTITACAVLQLAEQGSVGLDSPIAYYLDGRLPSSDATVRQTLLHTAGFANPNPLSWVHLANEHNGFDQVRFVNGILRDYGRPVSTPGQRYAYSNVGYLVLGELVATLTRGTYRQWVQDHMIASLGLQNGETLAFAIPDAREHACPTMGRFSVLNLLLGVFLDRGRLVEEMKGPWVLLRKHNVNGDAYGGLIGNAGGFARYLQALLGTGDFLASNSRSLMFSASRAPGPPRGLGWFMGRLGNEPWFAHAGGGAGYYCELRVYPKIHRASVVMFNRTGIRDECILNGLDRFLVAEAR